MKNILALIGLAFVVFVGAGWYLEWYKFESAATTKDGKTHVSVEVNASKIGNDAGSFHDRIADLMSKVEDKADNAKVETTKEKVEEKKPANPFGVQMPIGK